MSRAILDTPAIEHMPPFTGASEWLNSPPLSLDDLKGKVVLVSFWTYTCVNWLRTLPYLRAWWENYQDEGLVIIGVHTPEFSFEHSIDNIEAAMRSRGITYPVVVDNSYAIWSAFANHYWPALYFIDADGRIRYRQFGEGEYETSESVLQQLLTEAGAKQSFHDFVSVHPKGAEVAADWDELHTPETYLGYGNGMHFASPEEVALDRAWTYSFPKNLGLNQWALAGSWTIAEESAVLQEAGGQIAFNFHARDLNMVMGPVMRGGSIKFTIVLDDQPLGSSHGEDTDEDGAGVVTEQRLYQLIRQPNLVQDHRFVIMFLSAGVQAPVFTFG
jgi:thiol-disulfide isomerase/thioredoxin